MTQKYSPAAYCFRCRDSGWIVAVHREHKSAYGFKCNNCGRGTNRSASIPTWNDLMGKIYDTEFETQNIRLVPKPDTSKLAANDKTLDESECPF